MEVTWILLCKILKLICKSRRKISRLNNHSFIVICKLVNALVPCIGNMRSGTEALCAYFHTRDIAILHKALTYFGVIGLFALGAGLGALLTNVFAVRAIWFSCALLTISFFMMFIKEEQKL